MQGTLTRSAAGKIDRTDGGLVHSNELLLGVGTAGTSIPAVSARLSNTRGRDTAAEIAGAVVRLPGWLVRGTSEFW